MTKIGTDQEFIAATCKKPVDLTDRDLEIIGSTHPHIEKQLRAERGQAIEAILEKRAAEDDAELRRKSVEQQQRLTATARPQKDEDWDAFVKRCSSQPLSLRLFDKLFDVYSAAVREFLQDMNEKNKERNAKIAALETRVRALHSYDVPEVVALPVVAGSGPYLAWLADSTKRG